MRIDAALVIWVVISASAVKADQRRAYIPEPQPAPTKILIGAHHCPLWEADKPKMWDQVVKHQIGRAHV